MFQRIPLNELIIQNKKRWASFMLIQKMKKVKKCDPRYYLQYDLNAVNYGVATLFPEKFEVLKKGAGNEN